MPLGVWYVSGRPENVVTSTDSFPWLCHCLSSPVPPKTKTPGMQPPMLYFLVSLGVGDVH